MSLELKECIQKLKGSPLFYLFLSSRELFHTNFWYWLSTVNPSETFRLFSDTALSEEKLVFKREHNQQHGIAKSKVDLLISNGKRPLLAIENKIKDFPTANQLNRIIDSFNDELTKYVLVTLFTSPEISFNGWKTKTYRDISDALESNRFSSNQYHQYLISDYKEFCLNLSELASCLPISSNYDFANAHNTELFELLNEIKLWEGYQKLRASHLLFHFNNRLDIKTVYDINHQKATMVFFIELKDDYEIGITLESDQFRKYVGGKKIGSFAQNLLSNRLFFSDTFSGRGNKAFLKYDNQGNKQYRYQYEKILSPLSFEELFNKICFEIGEVIAQKIVVEECIPSA
jgi:hypothetical protein